MTVFVQQLLNGIMLGATYAVVALGFGLVFSVMRVLNMAHADLMVVGTYVAYLTTTALGGVIAGANGIILIALFLVILLAGATASGIGGLIIERLVLRPTRGSYILVPFIATLGVAIMLQAGAQALFGVDPVPVRDVIPSATVGASGVAVSTMQIATVATALAMMAALRYYVRSTRWGLATRAIAEHAHVAAACGANVNRVSQLTIGIASAMAGAAGVTLALLLHSASPFLGLVFGLKAFVCMLVAGNRHIEGIMAVGIGLGVLEALATGYVSSSYRDAIAFGVLLAILMARPTGLFGSYEA